MIRTVLYSTVCSVQYGTVKTQTAKSRLLSCAAERIKGVRGGGGGQAPPHGTCSCMCHIYTVYHTVRNSDILYVNVDVDTTVYTVCTVPGTVTTAGHDEKNTRNKKKL